MNHSENFFFENLSSVQIWVLKAVSFFLLQYLVDILPDSDPKHCHSLVINSKLADFKIS